jgi:hypothetical protein
MATLSENYTVVNENGEIVIRIERAAFDSKRVAALLNLLEFESIRQKSKLTAEEAESLANEINQNVWAVVKKNFFEG